MTGRTGQLRAREHRIIERPRLIKALEATEARSILFLAPAGYGKTTLARQWIRGVGRSIWLSCTPAHRDVAALALDLAEQLDEFGTAASKEIREYVSAQSNPQKASRKIGRILASHLQSAAVQWIVIDDYHELTQAPEAEELIDVLRMEAELRLIAASRLRPGWATARRIIYGELAEFGQDSFAMTEEESMSVLGRRSGLAELARQAAGWPAVLALAANARVVPNELGILPSALHTYLAEEIFQTASAELQERLIRLALLPNLAPALIGTHLDVDGFELVSEARNLGFLAADESSTLHPLVREFLLAKLAERPDCRAQVHEAVEWSLRELQWAWALELVSRFSCDDLIEPVLRASFKQLVRNGHVATLSSFAAQVRRRPSFPPPSVDVVDAEVALRDGNLELAADLAKRANALLPHDHELRSHASAIRGHCLLQRAYYQEAEHAFAEARATAYDDHDETEGLHGVAVARIMGEKSDARDAVDELLRRKHESPTHLVRSVTAEIARRRFSDGIAGELPIEEAHHALPQVDDPRVRTSFAYTVAYALGQRAEYEAAQDWLRLLSADVEAFDLEFIRPHVQWLSALLRLGIRRFGEAERLLQSLEDSPAHRHLPHQRLNARLLRARLLLESGKAANAVELTAPPPDPQSYPSWRAEYIATRGLALACAGDDGAAIGAADSAVAMSRVVEVRVLASTARAVVGVQQGIVESGLEMMEVAETLGAWDPVVCALRASRELSDSLAGIPSTRLQLERLYAASHDLGLARRAGFRVRSARSPGEVLTPRELEVLGLIARGMRNQEIAAALFISQSTAKVHVRHVLEKLGVRTRAEAVARYEMFNDAE
jgi:LuxR family transcriptional regulator, maltose regulon positive regulatory protein